MNLVEMLKRSLVVLLLMLALSLMLVLLLVLVLLLMLVLLPNTARKALNVVENVEHVLAIEILCACQAIEFFRPLKTTPALEAVHALVRKQVKPWDTDRHMSPSIVHLVYNSTFL